MILVLSLSSVVEVHSVISKVFCVFFFSSGCKALECASLRLQASDMWDFAIDRSTGEERKAQNARCESNVK